MGPEVPTDPSATGLAMPDMEGAIVYVPCRICGACTKHDVAAHRETLEVLIDGEGQAWHQILRCRGCGTTCFRQVVWHRGRSEPAELFYPELVQEAPPIECHDRLPNNVQLVYRELRRALVRGLPMLSAMAVRTLIELTCTHLGIDGHISLKRQIDELATKGHIPTRDADVLQLIRKRTNVAVHEGIPLPADKLRAAVSIVENMLRNAYVTPHDISAFEATTTTAATTTTTTTEPPAAPGDEERSMSPRPDESEP